MPATTTLAPRDPPVPAPANGPGAGLVALADRCVQCGLCLPHCPTYQLDRHESESPRGRIAYARAVATGALAPTPVGDLHLDHCLGCRRCEPVCPAGVRYGELLVAARAAQAPRRRRPWRERAALALLARPRALDRLLGLYRLLAGTLPGSWRPFPVPPATVNAPPVSPAAAATTGDVAIFVGCIARRYEAPTRAALVRLLAAAGIGAHHPDGQGCCGAAARHAGAAAQGDALDQANREAFAGAGPVLCLASGCHDTLARGLDDIAAVDDPLALLDRVGARLRWRPSTARIALHLPCTQRSVVGTGPATRRLLARIPGLQVVELPDTGCCGAAGLHQLTVPDRAAAFRQPLLEAFAASGATRLLSANIGCRLHLAGGTTLPVVHPIDFLAEHLE